MTRSFYIICFWLIFANQLSYGQKFLNTSFTIGNTNYFFEVTKSNEGFYTFTLLDNTRNTDKKKEFSMQPLLLDAFKNGFKDEFKNLFLNQSDTAGLKAKFKDIEEDVNTKAGELFIQVVAAEYSQEDDSPIAGRITIQDSICLKAQGESRSLDELAEDFFSKFERKKNKIYKHNLYQNSEIVKKLLRNKKAIDQRVIVINRYIDSINNYLEKIKELSDIKKTDSCTNCEITIRNIKALSKKIEGEATNFNNRIFENYNSLFIRDSTNNYFKNFGENGIKNITKLQINEFKFPRYLKLGKDSLFVYQEYLNDIIKNLHELVKVFDNQKILKIDYYQFEFNEGFIENILVLGHIEGESSNIKYKFINDFPIGFTARKNYEQLKNYSLREINYNTFNYKLKLSDLIQYQENLRLNTRDYSPLEQIIEQNKKVVDLPLKKEETSKLFQISIFSDFTGLNSEKPNGLVQSEINKKINIFTKRYSGVYNFIKSRAFNTGLFNFIEPFLHVSKIEENNRHLALTNNGRLDDNLMRADTSFASTLDILQYQNLSTGLLLNIFSLDNSRLKFSAFLNLGFQFGRTAILDSSRTIDIDQRKLVANIDQSSREFGINTLQFVGEFALHVKPDERYGLNLGLRVTRIDVLSNSFTQLGYYPRITESNRNLPKTNELDKYLWRFQMLAYFKPNKDSANQLFFRYQINTQLNDLNYNFQQIQLGYSFYLLRRNNTK